MPVNTAQSVAQKTLLDPQRHSLEDRCPVPISSCHTTYRAEAERERSLHPLLLSKDGAEAAQSERGGQSSGLLDTWALAADSSAASSRRSKLWRTQLPWPLGQPMPHCHPRRDPT